MVCRKATENDLAALPGSAIITRNTRARELYKKPGYREIGILPCVFNGIRGVQPVMPEKRLFAC